MDINGVEILRQTEVITTKYNPVLFWIGIVFLALAIVFIICEIWYRANYTPLGGPFDIIAAVCFVIFILAFVLGSVHKRTEPTGQYMYEVFIDDSVGTKGMKEIYERYEIVDTKGDIYILKDIQSSLNTCRVCNNHFDKGDKFCPQCGNEIKKE